MITTVGRFLCRDVPVWALALAVVAAVLVCDAHAGQRCQGGRALFSEPIPSPEIQQRWRQLCAAHWSRTYDQRRRDAEPSWLARNRVWIPTVGAVVMIGVCLYARRRRWI